jgi:hypothetical protein
VNDQQQARLDRAEAAHKAYREMVGGWGDYEESISDLLADLFHYVRQLQVDREIDCTIEDLVATATMHFTAEIEENNE